MTQSAAGVRSAYLRVKRQSAIGGDVTGRRAWSALAAARRAGTRGPWCSGAADTRVRGSKSGPTVNGTEIGRRRAPAGRVRVRRPPVNSRAAATRGAGPHPGLPFKSNVISHRSHRHPARCNF